jgi:hypothetical protein
VVTKPRYTVERAAPDDVRRDVTRIWDDNLRLEATADRKFEWLYHAAPDRPPTIFMLHADNGAVGTAGVGLRRIHAGDRTLRAGLLADLAVDRDHRSVMPALSLVRDVKAWALGTATDPGAVDLAYGFPNHQAEGVFKRVGYRSLGTFTRYARVLRHAGYFDRITDDDLARVPAQLRPLAARFAASRVGAAVAGGALDLAQLVRTAPEYLAAARRFRLRWHARAHPSLDDLWSSARSHYQVVAARTAGFVDWRFFRAPDAAPLARRIVIASSRADDRPLAYAVFDRAADAAHVRDLFGHPEAIGPLFDRLTHDLYRHGVATISMRYLGAPWLPAILSSRGFRPRQSDRMVAFATSDRLDPTISSSLADPSSWHLTDADEDI